MPGCSGEPVVTTSCAFYFLHARLRVHRAPGIPCALCFGPMSLAQLGRIHAATSRRCVQLAPPSFCKVQLHRRSSSLPHLWGGWPAEGRSGGGLSVQRVVTSPPPRPQLRCGRPSPLKGEGQERATSAGKRGEVKNNCRANHRLLRSARNDGVRKVVCRQSRRDPSFETRPPAAPQDEVVTLGTKSDPHGEEAHRAVSNHVARLLFENSS